MIEIRSHGPVLDDRDDTLFRLIHRAECAQKREHDCAGTITIGPKGVTWECPLCGGDAARWRKEGDDA